MSWMSLEPPPVKISSEPELNTSDTKLPALAPLSVPNSNFPGGGRGLSGVGTSDPASFQTLSQSVDTVVEGPPPPDVTSPVLALPSSSKRSRGTGSPLPEVPGDGPNRDESIGALTTIVMQEPPARVALLAVRSTSSASGVSEA